MRVSPLIPTLFVCFFFLFPLFGKESALDSLNPNKPLYRRYLDSIHLRKAKSFIVSGDLDMARHFLRRINDASSNLFPLKRRYESLIFFLEKKYSSSLSILRDKIFTPFFRFREVCHQKLLAMIMAREMETFWAEFDRCSQANRGMEKGGPLWMRSFRSIMGVNLDEGEPLNFSDNETTMIQFKSLLYFDREKIIADKITEIPPESYEYLRFRELLAFVYYRTDNLPLALTLLEGLDSANADNIRGNMALEKKDYEKAFGHFKKALEKKPHSLNALDRIIPTAWILGRWQEGINLLKLLPEEYGHRERRLAIESAFLIKLGKFQQAEENMVSVKNAFKRNAGISDNPHLPKEIPIMLSYLALVMGDKRDLLENSHVACKNFNAFNCWLIYQQLLWEDLTRTLERSGSLHGAFDIEDLKKKEPVTPLQEEILVHQEDIEKLDSLP